MTKSTKKRLPVFYPNLRDFAPFVIYKKREKYPWRNVTFGSIGNLDQFKNLLVQFPTNAISNFQLVKKKQELSKKNNMCLVIFSPDLIVCFVSLLY